MSKNNQHKIMSNQVVIESTKMPQNNSLNSSTIEANFYIPTVIPPTTRRATIRKLITDLSVCLLFLISIILFFKVGKPYHRGFNCNDESLRYPYKENTISGVTNYLYSTLIPIITIFINEFFVVRKFFSEDESANLAHSPTFWKYYLWQVYLQIIPLGFAATSSQLLTDISKYSIGRLRPHFIDLCRPQLPDGQVLSKESNCASPYAYVTNYQCMNFTAGDRKLKDAHLSFMSGHSSFAAVCLIYLVLYIQKRFKWNWIGLLKPFYQALLLFLIFYTGFTRISDYKHHWSDVLCGLIQGTLVAVLVVFFVSDLIKPRSYQRVRDPEIDFKVNGNGNGKNNFTDLSESGV